MKQFILTFTSALLLAASALGSSEVCIDHGKKTITISAHYYFYGNEASSVTAKNCVDEINRQFNNGHKVQLNKSGDWLDVKVKVTHNVLNETVAESFSASNFNPKYNFVRIDTPPKSSRVTVSEHGLSSNFGYFITSNGLGTSTTCTHEFAHGLGLVHIDPCDWRGKGVPPIMAARGCRVDNQFQYNPKATTAADGGTVNPAKRQVHSKEFSLINMGDLNYKWVGQNKECASQGKVTRRIYRKDGSFYIASGPFSQISARAYMTTNLSKKKSFIASRIVESDTMNFASDELVESKVDEKMIAEIPEDMDGEEVSEKATVIKD